MLSGAQCRMARGLLRWSVRKLEETSGVSSMTIKRMELADGMPSSNINTLLAVRQAFVDTGKVEFIDQNGVVFIDG